MPQHEGAYAIVWLIRRLFRAMARRSDESLADLGIRSADRAVLEFLSQGEGLTVPAIAERYQVSRQHVQVTVNRLMERSLVAARPNPRHRRSPRIALTGRGRRLFARILERDLALVTELFAGIPERDLRTTESTLAALLEALQEGETHADDHG